MTLLRQTQEEQRGNKWGGYQIEKIELNIFEVLQFPFLGVSTEPFKNNI